MCPLCLNDVEHVLHLFFDREFARKCWQSVNLLFDMQEVEYAAYWPLDKLSKEPKEQLITITKVLSGIRYARNKKVWEAKDLGVNIVMEMSDRWVKEWQEVNVRIQMPRSQLNSEGGV